MHDHDVRCFDGSHQVPLDRVVDLLPLTHSEETVRRYREAMRSGELFPPVSVLPLFGRYVIADGHKRYQAARPLISATMTVEVWTFRRFLADQWRQARANARKNARILTRLFVSPSESWTLLRSTLRHWLRVARCLRLLVAGRR